jgi:hypothetical protein
VEKKGTEFRLHKDLTWNPNIYFIFIYSRINCLKIVHRKVSTLDSRCRNDMYMFFCCCCSVFYIFCVERESRVNYSLREGI